MSECFRQDHWLQYIFAENKNKCAHWLVFMHFVCVCALDVNDAHLCSFFSCLCCALPFLGDRCCIKHYVLRSSVSVLTFALFTLSVLFLLSKCLKASLQRWCLQSDTAKKGPAHSAACFPYDVLKCTFGTSARFLHCLALESCINGV